MALAEIENNTKLVSFDDKAEKTKIIEFQNQTTTIATKPNVGVSTKAITTTNVVATKTLTRSEQVAKFLAVKKEIDDDIAKNATPEAIEIFQTLMLMLGKIKKTNQEQNKLWQEISNLYQKQKEFFEAYKPLTSAGVQRQIADINYINPQNFNSKIYAPYVWTKGIFTPEMQDKIDVKTYIQDIKDANPNDTDLQQLNIVKTYETYGKFADVDVDELKAKYKTFVIKPTLQADGKGIFRVNENDVYMCQEYVNKTIDFQTMKQKLKETSGYYSNIGINKVGSFDSRYKQYKKPSRILVEENIMNDKNTHCDETPYRFYCADGKVVCCRLKFWMYGIESFANTKKEAFLDKNKNEFAGLKPIYQMTEQQRQDAKRLSCSQKNYETMWRLAEKLSIGFPHIRVDLLCLKNKEGKEVIYFNELQPTTNAETQRWLERMLLETQQKYADSIDLSVVPDEKLEFFGKLLKQRLLAE